MSGQGKDVLVTSVVLFHSALGLRAVEHTAAELLRSDGHEVWLPDLYDGRAAADLESGLALMREVGWEAICGRARAAVRDVPGDAVLMGISMGAGVVGEIWPDRPAASAVVLIHGHAAVPAGFGSSFELHAGGNDAFVDLSQWTGKVWSYPGLSHFFTDPTSPDYDPAAASTLWTRVRRAVR